MPGGREAALVGDTDQVCLPGGQRSEVPPALSRPRWELGDPPPPPRATVVGGLAARGRRRRAPGRSHSPEASPSAGQRPSSGWDEQAGVRGSRQHHQGPPSPRGLPCLPPSTHEPGGCRTARSLARGLGKLSDRHTDPGTPSGPERAPRPPGHPLPSLPSSPSEPGTGLSSLGKPLLTTYRGGGGGAQCEGLPARQASPGACQPGGADLLPPVMVMRSAAPAKVRIGWASRWADPIFTWENAAGGGARRWGCQAGRSPLGLRGQRLPALLRAP